MQQVSLKERRRLLSGLYYVRRVMILTLWLKRLRVFRVYLDSTTSTTV